MQDNCISYRRGLTGVAYPLGRAMRGPKRWDKQEQTPTSFRMYPFHLYASRLGGVYRLKGCYFMLHIGKLIRQKMEERQITVVWLARRLSCSRTNVYKIFDKYSLDTEVLAKISDILEYDFFSLYSEEIRRKRDM